MTFRYLPVLLAALNLTGLSLSAASGAIDNPHPHYCAHMPRADVGMLLSGISTTGIHQFMKDKELSELTDKWPYVRHVPAYSSTEQKAYEVGTLVEHLPPAGSPGITIEDLKAALPALLPDHVFFACPNGAFYTLKLIGFLNPTGNVTILNRSLEKYGLDPITGLPDDKLSAVPDNHLSLFIGIQPRTLASKSPNTGGLPEFSLTLGRPVAGSAAGDTGTAASSAAAAAPSAAAAAGAVADPDPVAASSRATAGGTAATRATGPQEPLKTDTDA